MLISSTVHHNTTSVLCCLHTSSVSGKWLISSRHTGQYSGIWSCTLTQNFWPSYTSIQDSSKAKAGEKYCIYLGNKIISAFFKTWCTISIFMPHKLSCYFIKLSFLVHIIFMFYIKNVLNLNVQPCQLEVNNIW